MEQKTGLAPDTTLAFVSKLAQVTRSCPQIWLQSADKLPVWKKKRVKNGQNRQEEVEE